MKLRELATRLGAELVGDGDIEITGVTGVRDATEGDVTYITGEQFLKDLETSHAGAVLVPLAVQTRRVPVLRVRNPKRAFATALELFYVGPYAATGISEKAAIGRRVTVGIGPSIYPFAVVDDDAVLGDRVTLYPGVFVGKGSRIGDDSVVYPNVSIREGVFIGRRAIIHAGTVIGSDGFGFVTDEGKHHKIPQVGGVIIEDDVEIGGNCTIDRASLGNTLIKKGTKLDNQVHVAHNVTIGEHCLLAGQVGIAGSSTLGNYVIFGGQVGVADHTTVGDGVMSGGKAVIAKDVEAGQIIAGFNAMPIKEWLKVQAVLPKLPELKKVITKLEKEFQKLYDKTSS